MRPTGTLFTPTDQTQWLALMANHLGNTAQFEKVLDQILPGYSRAQDIQATLRALGAACLSDQFEQLGLDTNPPTPKYTQRASRRRMLWLVGLAIMRHAQDAEDRQLGIEILEKTKGILTHENNVPGDLGYKLGRACVATDNIAVVKWCANFLCKDLHEYFQLACDEHREQLFLAMAPKQAKRFNNVSLQRAIANQNLELVNRLLPYSVPKKNSSVVLRVAVDIHMELEGLGPLRMASQRIREMSDLERNERLQRSDEILQIITKVTDPMDAMWHMDFSRPSKRKERECELFLRHASHAQLVRLSNSKRMREAIPQVKALYVKRQLERMGRRSDDGAKKIPRRM